MKILIPILCTLALASVGTALANPYVSSLGYAIDPPSGWTPSLSADGTSVSFTSGDADTDSARISISSLSLRSSQSSDSVLKSAPAEALAGLQAKCKSVAVRGRGQTELGGLPASFLTVEYTRRPTDPPYKMAQIYAVRGASLFVVTLASTSDQYTAVHDQFDAALAAFSFTPSAEATTPGFSKPDAMSPTDTSAPASSPIPPSDSSAPPQPSSTPQPMSLAPAVSSGSSYHSDHGYLISAPGDWTVLPHFSNDDVAFVEKGASVFAANMIVRINPNPDNESAATLASTLNVEPDSLTKGYAEQPDFKVVDHGTITVGGKPAVYAIATMRNDQAGGVLRLRVVEAPQPDGIYVFTSLEKDSERSRYDMVIDGILDSIQWVPSH